MPCSRGFFAILLCVLLAIGAAGCGGSGSGPGIRDGAAGVPSAGLAAVPGPAELLKSASTGGEVRLDGKDYEDAWPHQRVERSAALGVYSPQAGNPPQYPDMAHAIYHFNIAGLVPQDRLVLNWPLPPAAGDLWIGLSDWRHDRWHFIAADNPADVAIPGLAGYANAQGDLLVLLLVGGMAECRIEWLKVLEGVAEDWLQYGHDPQNTMRSPFSGPQSPDVKWIFHETGSTTFILGPVMGPDGTVYYGCGNELRAYSPAGQLNWRLDHCAVATDEFTVGPTGVIYAPCWDGNLCAVNPDGSFKWKHDFGEDDMGGPVLGPQGEIYLTVQPNGEPTWLYALSPAGAVLWRVATGNYISDLVVGPQGWIYFIDRDRLSAVDAAGQLVWQSAVIWPHCAPVFASNGAIYTGGGTGTDKMLYALNASGAIEWSVPELRSYPHKILLLADGSLCVGTQGRLYFFNAAGVELARRDSLSQRITPYLSPNGKVYVTADTLLVLDQAGELVQDQALPLEGKPLAFDANGNVYTAIQFASDHHSIAAYDENLNLRWEAESGAAIYISPTLDQYGNIYLTSYDQYLLALSHAGDLKWRRALGDTMHRVCAAVGADGTIFACSYDEVVTADNFLYALDQAGTELWNYPLLCNTSASPVIGPDGTVYQMCMVDYELEQGLYAFDPDGTCQWLVDGIYPTSRSHPALAEDGTLYVASQDGRLVALAPDGSSVWDKEIYSDYTNTVSTYLTVADDGTLYAACRDSLFRAINPDGTDKWTFEYPAGEFYQPALGWDGTVYSGNTTGVLFALNADGTQKWVYDTGAEQKLYATVGGDGTIYLCGEGLYALSPAGQLLWESEYGWGVNPVLGADGTLYSGNGDKLVALGGAQ